MTREDYIALKLTELYLINKHSNVIIAQEKIIEIFEYYRTKLELKGCSGGE